MSLKSLRQIFYKDVVIKPVYGIHPYISISVDAKFNFA